MRKLISLGCSLSPYDGWPTALKDHYENSHTHYYYALGGSSNGIQIYLLEDHIIKHGVSEGDIFVFSMTGHKRPWGVVGQDDYNKSPDLFNDEDEYSSITETGSFKKIINSIDDSQRYILIQSHRLLKEAEAEGLKATPRFWSNAQDPYIELQRLLFTLLMIRKAGGIVVVFRGWTGALEEKTWYKFTEHFKNNDIDYTDECIIEWCLKNDYAFMDEFHPKSKYVRRFGEEILLPILSRHIS